MIGRLTGRVGDELDGGVLVLDVAGVGYEVHAPLGTRGRLTPSTTVPPEDAIVTLHVHTHVREDALQLFGFATRDERDAFRTIIGISNIGPKLGLALLGSVALEDLVAMVERGDGGRLTTIPGVGKKTAERLLLELKGKLQAPASSVARRDDPRSKPHPKGKNAELLLGALTRMGYRPGEAERAIDTLAGSQDLEAASLGDLVRDALGVLSK